MWKELRMPHEKIWFSQSNDDNLCMGIDTMVVEAVASNMGGGRRRTRGGELEKISYVRYHAKAVQDKILLGLYSYI